MKILGMEVYRRKTDEEIVERIRKMFRRSKWFRCMFLALSLLYVGLIVFGGNLLSNFRDLTENPHQYDMGLILGFIFGLFLSGIAFHAGHVFYKSIRPLSGLRIERLLLDYHDELQALGRIPQEEQHV